MDKLLISSLISNIYSIFGKNLPNKAIQENLIEKLSDVPNESFEHILHHFESMDELKSNLNIGKIVKKAADEWREKNGIIKKAAICSFCGGAGGWFLLKPRPTSTTNLQGYEVVFSPCVDCVGHNFTGEFPKYGQLAKMQDGGKFKIVPKGKSAHLYAQELGLCG